MSYLVLARKCRPQRFDEVVGQEHVTRTLANAIEMDRVAHGFIFSGVRGVGKTSLARILAKSLNCKEGPTPSPCGECESCRAITSGTAVDVIEIDGASNNSVDDIRELRDTVPYRPQLGRFKIYVIDEVHMLSVSAFNALLKTLEEPPPHVKFIFATTEPHKIPPTILSRCQRYDFRRIPNGAIIERIRTILKDEGIEAEEGALATIGREAEGSMRDALSVLDQVLAAGSTDISAQAVADLLGVVSRRVFYDLSEAILQGDARRSLEILRDVDRQGFETTTFARGFLEHLRNLVVAGVCAGDKDLLDLPEDEIEDLFAQTSKTTPDTLHRMFKHFSEAYEEIARSSHPRILFEASVARISQLGKLLPAQEILARLEALAAKGPAPSSGGGSTGFTRGGPSGPPGPASGPPPGRTPTRSAPAGEQPVVAKPEPPVVDVSPPSREQRQPESRGPARNDSPITEAEWKRILADFSAKKPAKSSIVERGMPAEGSTRSRLILEFDQHDGFTASRARDPDFQRDLVRFLSDNAGHKVDLEVRLCDLGATSTLAQERLEKQEAYRKREEEARDHPVVKSAQAAFGGKISKVRLSKGFDEEAN